MEPKFRNQDKLVKLLAALFPECTLYLFGSRARKTHKPSSDIDLAIDARHKLTMEERALALNIIAALNIPQKVDLVDLNSTIPPELTSAILKEGIILWKK